jgi:zinc protease
MENGKWKMENSLMKSMRLCISSFFVVCFCLSAIALSVCAQQNPPAPLPARVVKVPAINSQKLPNGLTVVAVERKNVPLVTVSLLIKCGATCEEKDGLANMTAELLTKGTKTRTATQIAEQIEFLGGEIETTTDWNSTVVSINVTSDKLEQALTIMSDVVLNPTFAPKEIELFKNQTIDELNVALKQPSRLASFVASRYTFGEHVAVGTPESLKGITKADIGKFYRQEYLPESAVLVFAGDISNVKANSLARKFFGLWKNPPPTKDRLEIIQRIDESPEVQPTASALPTATINNILVVDLPNSGQAAVTYTKKLKSGREDWDEKTGKVSVDKSFFPAMVANTILGGGYSARLNEEIRIKRGLSYGAGSSLNWRGYETNFATRTQTKNVSAAEVAELVAGEINKLSSSAVEAIELSPRKLTLTGDFGRDLETTEGLAEKIVELYTFELSPSELNSYMSNVQNVSAEQVKQFASENFKGGDIIIVGDAKIFMDDLKKRFPNQKIEVIAASDLDLNKADLRKTSNSSGGGK